MASLSSDQLHAIVDSETATYTDLARQIAKLELDGRDAIPVAADHELAESSTLRRVTDAIEDAVLKPLFALRTLWRDLLAALQATAKRWDHDLVPPDIPNGIRELFYLGVGATVPAVVIVILGGWNYLATGGGIYAVTIGVAGLLTAYGIRARSAYPQLIAPLVVAGTAAHAILSQVRSGIVLSTGMYAIAVAAFATIKYLFRSPEAVEYYRRLRTQGVPAGVTD